MRVTRPVLCLTVAVALVAAGSASAATKPKPKPKSVPPVCNLVVDPAGDANGTFLRDGVMPSSEDGVDIVSADVATDAKVLTTVIRVKKLTTSSASAPGGLHWKFFFTVDEVKIYTQAVAATGANPIFRFGTIDGTSGTSKSLGEAPGVLDVAKNEVRVSVPLSALPATVKAGTKINTFDLSAGRYYSAGVSLSDATDAAASEKTYVAGALSCVTPGK